MLLTLDRPQVAAMEPAVVVKPPLVGHQDSLVGGPI
jgi:hypothetical protein